MSHLNIAFDRFDSIADRHCNALHFGNKTPGPVTIEIIRSCSCSCSDPIEKRKLLPESTPVLSGVTRGLSQGGKLREGPRGATRILLRGGLKMEKEIL